MKYGSMTDLQINEMVFEAVKESIMTFIEKSAISNNGSSIFFGVHEINYCNNPSDAWPIIVDNAINIKFLGSDWETGWTPYAEQDGFHSGYHKNPLRCAMIVFLRMQEGK